MPGRVRFLPPETPTQKPIPQAAADCLYRFRGNAESGDRGGDCFGAGVKAYVTPLAAGGYTQRISACDCPMRNNYTEKAWLFLNRLSSMIEVNAIEDFYM